MGAFKINRAEKGLLVHLARGGDPGDQRARTLIDRFAETVTADKTTAPILEKYGFGKQEVAELYQAVLADLMPEPWMQAGGPMLVPTQWFMEPHRLDFLLAESDGPQELRANAKELARQTLMEHKSEHGPANVERFKKGAGCASLIVVALAGAAAFVAG